VRRWAAPFLCRRDGRGHFTGFELTVETEVAGHVVDGYVRRGDEWYPIIHGVPYFFTGALSPDLHEFARRHGLPLPADDVCSISSQKQTSETFSFKWSSFQHYGDAQGEKDFLFAWYRRKFGLREEDDLANFYAHRNYVLEVGPGSGFNTRFIAQHCKGKVFAVDISEAADVTFNKTRDLENCAVIRADLMDAPFQDELFDLIIADGVLHHTPNTEAAVRALYRKVRPGGEFFFYVYKKMGAARQFCDEHIRREFSKLSPEACLEACRGLTKMGRELSRLDATITLEQPIKVLSIPAGTHDVQRLVYYNFVKCFWNDAFDFETNNMINFDWYHPQDAWQHTPEEVGGWLKSMGVSKYRFNDANPNGISVLLTKPAAINEPAIGRDGDNQTDQ
jgi:SAM-dependent methyltransferase